MAGLAATTLLWRGTVLDRAWTLNPTAYRQLSPLGSKVGILFLILSAALAVSGVGWFRRRLWGWRLAVAIIATQVLGDIINLVRGGEFGLDKFVGKYDPARVTFGEVLTITSLMARRRRARTRLTPARTRMGATHGFT